MAKPTRREIEVETGRLLNYWLCPPSRHTAVCPSCGGEGSVQGRIEFGWPAQGVPSLGWHGACRGCGKGVRVVAPIPEVQGIGSARAMTDAMVAAVDGVVRRAPLKAFLAHRWPAWWGEVARCDLRVAGVLDFALSVPAAFPGSPL